MTIFLLGNISEGFTAYGPYADADECLSIHSNDEGWMLTLNPTLIPKETT